MKPREFGTLERYWNDPAYRAKRDEQECQWHKEANAIIDRAISRHRAKAGDQKRNAAKVSR